MLAEAFSEEEVAVVEGGVGDERPVLGDLRLAALQGVFIELRRPEVPVQGGQVTEAKTVRAEVSIVLALLDHHTLPPFPRILEI